MEHSAGSAEIVPSINPPHQVSVTGFELADEAAHMIAWLGKGQEFRRFVTNDLEAELYRQTPGAQLLSVKCNARPELRTKAIQAAPGQGAIVTDVCVTFLVTVEVRASDGALWFVDIRHNYEASDIHRRGLRKLRLNFGVVAARKHDK